MRNYHRLLVGGGLLLLITGCKWELAETNVALDGETSFTLTRSLSTDSFSNTGQSFNPTSCLSLPQSWDHEVAAEFTTGLESGPELAITEQSSAAQALEASVPRDDYEWHCYSAFDTDTVLGSAQGSVTYILTPEGFNAPVQLMTSLGTSISEVKSALIVQDIFPNSLPDGEPVRLEATTAINGEGGLIPAGNRVFSSQAFQGKLFVAGFNGLPITAFSDNGDTFTGLPANTLSAFSGPLTVIDDELLLPLLGPDSVYILSTTDGDNWEEVDTTIAISGPASMESLTLDEANNRWLLVTDEEAGPNAYYLSADQGESRFTVLLNPGPASALSVDTLYEIQGADEEFMALAVDDDGIYLVRMGATDWIVTTLLETSERPESVIGLVSDGMLYVAVGGNGESADFYQQALSSDSGLQVVSELPAFSEAYDFQRAGNTLVLATDADLLVSNNDGATWEPLLATALNEEIGESWVVQAVQIHAITDAELLVSVEMGAQSEPGSTLIAMLKINRQSAAVRIMGGSGTKGTRTSPNTPNNSWQYLGSVDGNHYRTAFDIDTAMVMERFALTAMVSAGEQAVNSNSSSGGGGVPTSLLFILILLGWKRRCS